MPLTFTCPNGHPISCAESFSGKPAKCPQCSVKFIVPPEGQQKADPLPKKESTGDSDAAKKDAEPKEEEIVFLCPNEHKLNAPKRLQGKAGQCPECGAKFRIPSYEESPDDDNDDTDEEDEILVGEVVGDDEVFDADDLEEIEIVEDFTIRTTPDDRHDDGYEYSDSDSDMPIDAATVMDFVPTLPDFDASNHALSGIFQLLWQQRHYGGNVEMQLAEGELLNPDFFSPELSQATHGVFATQNKDGSFTIVTVPWDKVLRVTLKKTDELPPGLFEE